VITSKVIPVFQKGFASTSRFLVKQNFTGPYLDKDSFYGISTPWPSGEGLFLYATHASWWDPIAAGFLAIDQMKLRVIAPMDEEQFKKHISLRFVGVFGVSEGDGAQVETYIKKEISEHKNTCVWVTPQGTFWPNELAQPAFKSGLSRWSAFSGAQRVPVVVHYHFASTNKPMLFYRVGKALPFQGHVITKAKDLLRQALDQETSALLAKIHKATCGKQFDTNGFIELG